MKKKIKDSVDKIREECDSIEESVEAESEEDDEDEDKNGRTRGDQYIENFSKLVESSEILEELEEDK